MAHFAELDENNAVIRVLVVPDDQEHRGQDFLANDLKLGGTWVQTSYNNRIRHRYAGIGMKYDAERDAFITKQPYASWTLDDNHDWVAPKPKPGGNKEYEWNEDAQKWDTVSTNP